MNGKTARLIVRRGQAEHQEYGFKADPISIGREAINDIVLLDPEISRRHSRLVFREGRHFVEDLDSTNGTFVNGRRISTIVPLNDGDIIDLGDTVSFLFKAATDIGATVVETPSEVAERDMTAQEARPGTEEWLATESENFPQESLPAPLQKKKKGNQGRILLGIGCLVILIIVLCLGAVILIDALAPDLLYCGPLQPIFEALGFNLQC